MAWIPLFVQIRRKEFNVLDSSGSLSFVIVRAIGITNAPVTIDSAISQRSSLTLTYPESHYETL